MMRRFGLLMATVLVSACGRDTVKDADPEPVIDITPDDTDSQDDTDVDTDDTIDTDAPGDAPPEAALLYIGFPRPSLNYLYPVSATVTDGVMVEYVVDDTERPTIGTCTAVDVGTHGSVTWGRWEDGETGGVFPGGALVFGPGQGLHYALIDPPATGGVFGVDGTWTQVGSTTLTDPAGTLGGSSSWEAVVTRGDPPLIALSMTATSGEIALAGSTAGWPDPAASVIYWTGPMFYGTFPATGCAGPTECSVLTMGYFAEDGETMAIAFWNSPDTLAGVTVLAAP